MEKEDFKKLKIIEDFMNFIIGKNYSEHTLISYAKFTYMLI